MPCCREGWAVYKAWSVSWKVWLLFGKLHMSDNVPARLWGLRWLCAPTIGCKKRGTHFIKPMGKVGFKCCMKALFVSVFNSHTEGNSWWHMKRKTDTMLSSGVRFIVSASFSTGSLVNLSFYSLNWSFGVETFKQIDKVINLKWNLQRLTWKPTEQVCYELSEVSNCARWTICMQIMACVWKI